MDVLAMRKSTGEITGEICLNGHPQEEKSFRRCMGYVEQFDTQTPELTIRETCDFSAKLRLDENDATVTPDSTRKFVDQTLAMLELTNIQDLQVGSDESGGLSFEQRKRLSIAVELVAVSILCRRYLCYIYIPSTNSSVLALSVNRFLFSECKHYFCR
jgi:ABC-type multidrug transport system ATPase subunit